MFPIPLRSYKSDRSLRKIKKGKANLSWSTKLHKPQSPKPDVDFAAFPGGRPPEDDLVPLQVPASVRARCISRCTAKRDSILIDLTNGDLLPALDYAFAILDADDSPTRSALPSPLPSTFSSGSSSRSMPCTPSSVRSTPPRYIYVSSPLSSSSSGHSSLSSTRSSPQDLNATLATPDDDAFDPHELSRALSHAQADRAHETTVSADPSPTPSVPFPPPATPPAARVPLLQRKPRLLHSADSSIDSHESFISRNHPSSSKLDLARSVSSLDHYRDVFGSRGACTSSTSVNTIDSGLSALLARYPHAPSSLKLFSSPKKSRHPVSPRRASTPPPSRGRLGIPSAQPPVPALPDIFLLSPAARREAVSDSNSLLSRSFK